MRLLDQTHPGSLLMLVQAVLIGSFFFVGFVLAGCNGAGDTNCELRGGCRWVCACASWTCLGCFQGEVSPFLDLLFSPCKDRMKEREAVAHSSHLQRDYFTPGT